MRDRMNLPQEAGVTPNNHQWKYRVYLGWGNTLVAALYAGGAAGNPSPDWFTAPIIITAGLALAAASVRLICWPMMMMSRRYQSERLSLHRHRHRIDERNHHRRLSCYQSVRPSYHHISGNQQPNDTHMPHITYALTTTSLTEYISCDECSCCWWWWQCWWCSHGRHRDSTWLMWRRNYNNRPYDRAVNKYLNG